MSDEINGVLANLLEPVGPKHQEWHPLGNNKSWAVLGYNAFDVGPVLFAHLKKLPGDLNIP